MSASPAIEVARPVDAIADAFVDECVQRYPETATYLGIHGHDDAWSDYSPDGFADQAAHLRRTIAALHSAAPSDDRENTAKEAMLERLGLDVELYEAHITTSRVSVIGGQAQEIRAIFDLMPTEGDDAWRNITARLRTVETPLLQVRQTLAAEARDGNISAVRQIRATIEQIRSWTGQIGDDDFFSGLVAAAPRLPDSLYADLAYTADRAREAFADFADWLGETSDRSPRAWTRWVRSGTRSTPATSSAPRSTSRRPTGGASTSCTGSRPTSGRSPAHWSAPRTSRRPTRLWTPILRVGSPAPSSSGPGCKTWPTGRSCDLAGTHFDIPEPIRSIECCIAPTHDGSIYYTDPAEDFSRPGQMWWAVPAEIDTFATWREVTTVYHEGVPGHHLQIGLNAYHSDLLNRWQRKLCFCSGHGEGWALYAEQLMDDLGYLEPGDRMGMLDAQAFRAIRVIIDIGMHLQLPIPKDNAWGFRPGERWTPLAGYEFMSDNCSIDEPTLRFELDRYLGWPGQAPSYKVGERVWLEARADAERRHGASFDLRRFHADALNLGPLGLDPLRAALARL